MTGLRHFLLQHRTLAVWLVALALVLKMLMPGGYMIGTSAGSLTVQLCSGYGPQEMTMAMPGMKHDAPAKSTHDKAEMPCAFAGLTTPSLAAADPLLLAAAIAFLFVTIFRATIRPAPARLAPRLRPPLRAPPALA